MYGHEDTEVHYQVICRMGVDTDRYVMGFASNEEDLKEVMDNLKKTWRHVYASGYRVRKMPEPQSKRKKK